MGGGRREERAKGYRTYKPRAWVFTSFYIYYTQKGLYIEALPQRVLEGEQQLESKVAAQSGQIQGLQNGLEGAQSKMNVVQADLDSVKGKLLVLDKLESSRQQI